VSPYRTAPPVYAVVIGFIASCYRAYLRWRRRRVRTVRARSGGANYVLYWECPFCDLYRYDTLSSTRSSRKCIKCAGKYYVTTPGYRK